MKIRFGQALVAAALLVVAAAACTDPTVAPKSTVSSANIFSDPNSYRSFIAKVYAGLAVTGQQGPGGNADISGIDEGFSSYLRLYWELEELPTDEAAIDWNDIGIPELNTMTFTTQGNMNVAMYYRIFFQVGMANEFLRQTTDGVLASRGVSAALKDTIQVYRAEARFLRALSYWHGLDLFGDIPLVTENDALGSVMPKQFSRDSIYNYVVSELNAIKTQLPAPGPTVYGRATTAAAHMLLAKLYLNAKVYTGTAHWTEAMSEVQAVLSAGFSLAPKYRNNFLADNNTSPEIIFAVPFDGTYSQTWGGTDFLIHASIGWNDGMNPNAYGVDGGWGGIRLKPEAYYNYAAGDTARTSFFYLTNHTIAMTDMWDFRSGVAAPKFSNVTSTGGPRGPSYVDTDFPVFRLADAYLMYAELFARGAGGSGATALGYVNAIRERAYGGASGDITLSQLDTTFVLHERGRELLWEGMRRIDLVRYGLFSGSGYIWSWKGGVQAGQTTSACMDIYPLPANELIANTNLKQKAGCYGG